MNSMHQFQKMCKTIYSAIVKENICRRSKISFEFTQKTIFMLTILYLHNISLFLHLYYTYKYLYFLFSIILNQNKFFLNKFFKNAVVKTPIQFESKYSLA